MIYNILACLYNKQQFERKNINLSHSFSFDVSNCSYAGHEIFVTRYEYCLHNVIGFGRHYFTSVQYSCVQTDKNEVCKHCKQLAHSVKFLVMTICINSRVVKKEFMEEMNFMKINHYLKKILKESTIFYFLKEKNNVYIIFFFSY